MASNLSLGSSNFCHLQDSVLSGRKLYLKSNLFPSKIDVKEQDKNRQVKNGLPKQFLFMNSSTFQIFLSKWIPPGALSYSSASDLECENCRLEDVSYSAKSPTKQVEFNRVSCLVHALHETARGFSVEIRRLDWVRTGPPAAMAWTGLDVHAWHKHIAYQVAAYALLKAGTEVQFFLSDSSCHSTSPVHVILSPVRKFLRDHIESQLKTRNPKLVEWFQTVELPRVSGTFMSLFRNGPWKTLEGIIMAITCCAAVAKVGRRQISYPLLSSTIEDALIELMDMANELVSVKKLHRLAIKARFEEDFLHHFGSKILPSKNIEDLEFWIGLVQRKLSAAFQRESVTKRRDSLLGEIQENSLATLALFAYLGRESRLFLSRNNITDPDGRIKDFLSYLECGILFRHHEFGTLSVYQLLMEVTVEEIGWLDLFASYNCHSCQKRISKHHPVQDEKEVILYTVFTTCSDVISAFTHCSSSLDANLLEFLLQSRNLLSACLEDYRAAYDITGDLPIIGERNKPDSAAYSFPIKGAKISLIMAGWQRRDQLRKREKIQGSSQVASSSSAQADPTVDLTHTCALKSMKPNFFRSTATMLAAASVNVWIGTRVLVIDISDTLRFLLKILCLRIVTKRERRKIKTTLVDIVKLIPMTILMILPVSAVGHAAIFAAIQKYMPYMIPSPFTEGRLNLVKQLNRTKKMKMEAQLVNIQDNNSLVL